MLSCQKNALKRRSALQAQRTLKSSFWCIISSCPWPFVGLFGRQVALNPLCKIWQVNISSKTCPLNNFTIRSSDGRKSLWNPSQPGRNQPNLSTRQRCVAPPLFFAWKSASKDSRVRKTVGRTTQPATQSLPTPPIANPGTFPRRTASIHRGWRQQWTLTLKLHGDWAWLLPPNRSKSIHTWS